MMSFSFPPKSARWRAVCGFIVAAFPKNVDENICDGMK
jgi:hypothetical protein